MKVIGMPKSRAHRCFSSSTSENAFTDWAIPNERVVDA
eukprot:CAMPEP_0198699982 /NCGR_PEP_ID=MMETSP1468-20131203/362626_1 /TAXON_ID=1461545 /ORGANISM="Mantoniella sp, Strain CCMP1436" /LENGTH=37 /DNA_ID= /DNA_START= /DNA_END= /DNA_ORIENTATION=